MRDPNIAEVQILPRSASRYRPHQDPTSRHLPYKSSSPTRTRQQSAMEGQSKNQSSRTGPSRSSFDRFMLGIIKRIRADEARQQQSSPNDDHRQQFNTPQITMAPEAQEPDQNSADSYHTCSEKHSVESLISWDGLSVEGQRQLANRSRKERRVIHAAKRKIFSASSDEPKPKRRRTHEARHDWLGQLKLSEEDADESCERWVAKHQDEFYALQRKYAAVSSTEPPPLAPLSAGSDQHLQQHPTYQLVYMTTLIPVNTSVVPPVYCVNLAPLLVPIGGQGVVAGGEPAVVKEENGVKKEREI